MFKIPKSEIEETKNELVRMVEPRISKRLFKRWAEHSYAAKVEGMIRQLTVRHSGMIMAIDKLGELHYNIKIRTSSLTTGIYRVFRDNEDRINGVTGNTDLYRQLVSAEGNKQGQQIVCMVLPHDEIKRYHITIIWLLMRLPREVFQFKVLPQ